MNKLTLNAVLLSVAFLSVLSSCSKTNKQPNRDEQIAEFRQSLTAQDTTAMLSLCDNAMEQLKARNIETVLALLHEYDDSLKQVSLLSAETRRHYERIFQMFPVLSYTREYFSFILDGCNDVKYKVTFATAEMTGQDHDATTMFMFNPVRVEDDWVLCVKGANDEFDAEMK